MKHINLIAALFIITLLASCSSNEKEIEVREPTFSIQRSGQSPEEKDVVEKVITVVPGTTKLRWNKTGPVPTLFVTLKLRKNANIDTDKYEFVDIGSNYYYAALADNNDQFFTISGDRADVTTPGIVTLLLGINIGDAASETAKIKDLLAAEVGTEADVSFVGVSGNESTDEAIKKECVSVSLISNLSIRKK